MDGSQPFQSSKMFYFVMYQGLHKLFSFLFLREKRKQKILSVLKTEIITWILNADFKLIFFWLWQWNWCCPLPPPSPTPKQLLWQWPTIIMAISWCCQQLSWCSLLPPHSNPQTNYVKKQQLAIVIINSQLQIRLRFKSNDINEGQMQDEN